MLGLFRPGVTVVCRSVCGSAVAAAAAGSNGVLSVEEEEVEEGSESVRGAALHSAFSTSMLCSGDPGVTGLLGHVSTMTETCT